MTDLNYRQAFLTPVAEKTTTRIELQLTNENDLPLTDVAVGTVTLWLYEERSKAVLNSRSGTDIRNVNGGTLSPSALLTLLLSDDDNALAQPTALRETHIALISWTWDAGTKTGRKELSFTVYNQAKVT